MASNDKDTLTNSQILTIIIGVLIGVLIIYFFYVGYVNTDCITKSMPTNMFGLNGSS